MVVVLVFLKRRSYCYGIGPYRYYQMDIIRKTFCAKLFQDKNSIEKVESQVNKKRKIPDPGIDSIDRLQIDYPVDTKDASNSNTLMSSTHQQHSVSNALESLDLNRPRIKRESF